MASQANPVPFQKLPSVDQVLRTETAIRAVERFGRPLVVASVRDSLGAARDAIRADDSTAGRAACGIDDIAAKAVAHLETASLPKVRPVFNLTGTVLHTNLGRALLAEEAIEAAVAAMRHALALEYDLEGGKRGERDTLIRQLLIDLTGAEDVTVVNNNAAAVLLALNTFADGKEGIVSRGELIEIGGAFRMPDIMARAGTRIVEVGTTNRTHFSDYVGAIRPETGLLLKVHTSNYRIEGFTRDVPAHLLAPLAKEHGVPLVNDLGSGTLVDLSQYGLSREPTVADAVAEGADIVTFSGDKLLGGPQAGFIAGRADLIARINKNPMKRAMRVDKIRLAAIEATLRLYLDPERVAQRLPTLRLLSRPKGEIEALSRNLAPVVADAVGGEFDVEVVPCSSQIGSGSLPQETIASAGIAVRPTDPKSGGHLLENLAAAFRDLPMPVIGRIADQSFILDLRCLEDEAGFRRNLTRLRLDRGA